MKEGDQQKGRNERRLGTEVLVRFDTTKSLFNDSSEDNVYRVRLTKGHGPLGSGFC